MATVRRIRVDEAAQVADLWDAAAREAAGLVAPSEFRPVLEAHLAANATHPAAFALVAEEDGGIIGFVTASLFEHPTMPGRIGELEELYVVAHARGRGVGTLLVLAAMERLRALGAGPIAAGVPIETESAGSFWERLDYRRDSVRWTTTSPIPGPRVPLPRDVA